MSELLRLENIHKAYVMGPAVVPVLRGVDLRVQEGEFVAIMGASGSGKSTLLHIAGALDQPDYIAPGSAGETPRKTPTSSHSPGGVFFKIHPLSSMGRWGRHHLRNHAFGFVFQFYHL